MRLLRLTLSCLVWLATLMTIGLCVEKYLSSEKGTRVSRVSSMSASLPSFTLCWRFGYSPSVLRHLEIPMDVRALISKHFPPTNMSVKAFLKATRSSLKQFLVAVTVTTRSPINKQQSSNDSTDDGFTVQIWSNNTAHDNDGHADSNMIKFRSVSDKIHGRCFTSSIPSQLVKYGIESILFHFEDVDNIATEWLNSRARGWNVRLHHEGQLRKYYVDFPSPASVESHYDLVYGLYQRLGNCSLSMNDAFDLHYESDVRALSLKKHGCYAFWQTDNVEEYSEICSDRSFYANSNLDDDIIAEIKEKYRDGNSQEPCELMRIRGIVGDEQRLRYRGSVLHTVSKLTLHLPEVVFVANQFEMYNLLSMVGEAGGYLGLFTGVSLILLADTFT